MQKSKEDWFNEVCAIAKSKRGECLSLAYINAGTHMQFRCEYNHTWPAMPASILRGSWCLICANQKINAARRVPFPKILKLIEDIGLKYISGEEHYIGKKSKILLKCEDHGNFPISIDNLKAVQKRGTNGCPKCARKTTARKLSLAIEVPQALAEKRGGKLLSTVYENNIKPLEWECALGHTFTKSYASVKGDSKRQGSWCPECFGSISEKIVRHYCETLMGIKCPSTWPEWLKNSDGNPMQVDGLNEEYFFAFEHHGSQHYDTNNKWYNSRLVKNDQEKAEILKKHGFCLLEIRELGKVTTLDQLKEQIIFFAQKHKLPLVHDYNFLEIELDSIYEINPLDRARDICTGYGGKLLSKKWNGYNSPLNVSCEQKDHPEFTIMPGKLFGKEKTWCRLCGIEDIRKFNTKYNLEIFKSLANERGGTCISEKYSDTLTFQCRCGYIWSTSNIYDVLKGSWCRKCSFLKSSEKQKGTIYECNELAKKYEGFCISGEIEYKTAKSKLKWKCKNNHIFIQTRDAIQQGKWTCKECKTFEKKQKYYDKISKKIQNIIAANKGELVDKNANLLLPFQVRCIANHIWDTNIKNLSRNFWCRICKLKAAGQKRRKYTLDDFKRLAISREGKCISLTYENTDSMLEFECKNNHIWKADASSVISGCWCRKCHIESLWNSSRFNIEYCKIFAQEHNGACLSEQYLNARKTLLWKCSQNHIWDLSLASMKDRIQNAGKWCLLC